MSETYVTTQEFEDYKKEATKKFGGAKVMKEKKTRAPNAYNLYMKEQVAELKKRDPTLSNQNAFKMGAAAWTKQKNDKAAASK